MGIWGILESIGIVGALTALIKLAKDIRDARIPLVMKARHFHVVWYEDNCAIVVFEMGFVNDSSQKRTVDNVRVSPPPVVTHRQYPFVPDEQETVSMCRLPIGGYPVPISEVLQPPLDIPPRQSLPRKMFAVYLQFPEQSGLPEVFPYRFDFFAWKPRRKLADDKPIATDSIWISSEQLRTVGSYPLQRH
jgi:hypothetical protein